MTIDKVTQAEATIPGYAPPIRRDRKAHDGGVAIWVKAGMPHKELDIDPSTQEIIWISIATNHSTRLGLCAAYRPVRPVMEYAMLTWMSAAPTNHPGSAFFRPASSPPHHWRRSLSAKPGDSPSCWSPVLYLQAPLSRRP